MAGIHPERGRDEGFRQHLIRWTKALRAAVLQHQNGVADSGSHVQIMQRHDDRQVEGPDQGQHL